MRTAVVLVFCIALLGVFASDLSKVAQRGPIAGRWDILRSAQSHETVNFKVLLKQRNLEKLEQIFWDVSTPSHENYGKFLTRQQIAEIVAPEKSSIDRVVSWLQMSGVPATSIGVATDYVQVQTTVKIASALFNTQFAVYKSTRSISTKLRILGAAHVPAALAADIDFVAGLTELIDNARIQPKTWPTLTKDNLGDDGLITPSVLKNFYNVPSNAVATGAATQGIAAFTDYFSVGALGAFEQYFNLPTANVTRSGPDCLNSEQCDQYESDLDVQYVTAMGSGVPTFFLAHADGEWILDWAQQLSSASNPPLVNSISYGWPELEQCELTEDCSTYGYNSQQYVTRTNTELQKLGSLGLTVLVSDGDDGAPSLYGASGNCPIDASQYCPTGGCDHTRTSCPELIFTLDSNNTLCFFPMGMGSNACQLVLSDTTRINNALNAWANANSNCQIAIEYDRTNDPHVYSSCTCDQLQSKSTGGYTIAPYQFDQNNGAVFTPEYPTSSPYVTSVGATQFVWRNNDVTSEISASIVTGAKITTGGGFSTFQAQPSYQSAAVSAYLSSSVGLPPSFAYDSSMRAYPDISFNGHNYLVFASNNTSDLDTCPCGSLPVDGTSCSSPALAGLLSLINDQLVAAGKSPLGFINPLLYQMYAQNPQSFNDVTSGENDCNRSYCCEYGWTATAGWDPVGGLGSPDFTQMSKYILGLKGVQAN